MEERNNEGQRAPVMDESELGELAYKPLQDHVLSPGPCEFESEEDYHKNLIGSSKNESEVSEQSSTKRSKKRKAIKYKFVSAGPKKEESKKDESLVSALEKIVDEEPSMMMMEGEGEEESAEIWDADFAIRRFRHACKEGDLELMKKAFGFIPDLAIHVGRRDDEGACLIHHMLIGGHLEALKEYTRICTEDPILANKLELLGYSHLGFNFHCEMIPAAHLPLCRASHIQYRPACIETFKYVLTLADIDVNEVDRLGRTLAHVCIWQRVPDLLPLLTERGAKYDIKDVSESTPYDLAI